MYSVEDFDGAFFLAGVEVAVSVPCHLDVAMTEAAGYLLYVYPLVYQKRGVGVPLWYIKDKRKNPITKGVVNVCRYFSILFPTKIHGQKKVE